MVVFMTSLGSGPVEDEPVPYSEELPTTADQQPVAATANTDKPAKAPAPATAPAAQPAPSVTFVRNGAQPFAV